MIVTPSDRRCREMLAELARLGSPVDLSVAAADATSGVVIRQQGEVHSSQVFELETGQVGYILNVDIFNNKTTPIDLLDCEIRTPWPDELFHWVRPTTRKFRGRNKLSHSYEVYRFPGESAPEFQGEDVLNHRLQEGGRLLGRGVLSGWLLAVGGRMPGPSFNTDSGPTFLS